MTALPPPDRLVAALADRYTFEGWLGRGATASVYLAHDLKHDRKVALKVLRPELAKAIGPERFIAEIRTTANLQHAHILPLFDSGEADGYLYYVMPYVAGRTLREELEMEGALPVDRALSIFGNVAGALSHAHARGVIHRDLKPENILLSDGEAFVADFGIALVLPGAGSERLTATGLALGTPTYMSPEQMADPGTVDARTDVYGLGCLLFEILAGRPPLVAESWPTQVARTLTDPPPAVTSIRPEVPEAVAEAVARALAKDPSDRFPSVKEFQEACRIPAVPEIRSRTRRLIPVLIVLITVGASGAVAWRAVQRSNARAALPEVQRLIAAGMYVDAYQRIVELERWIGGDSLLGAQALEASDLLTVVTGPSGAEVIIQRFDPLGESGREPERLGVTPIRERRLPRANHHVLVDMEGFASVERIASSELDRTTESPEGARSVVLDLQLLPEEESSPEMVPVPGGRYELTSPAAPRRMSTELDRFFIDRYEVTNRAYAQFVSQGGYHREEFWVSVPGDVRARLVDRTGLDGPRDWVNQGFPSERGRHPVAGVTWYEARAFCEWAGKRLPTVFEWEKTARDGRNSRSGVLMPWGYEHSTTASGLRANFNSDGSTPVDAFPFGISPWGAYGMAGNVREWMGNVSGSHRVTAGGSWQGPSYLYPAYANEDPAFTSAGLGFRCARSDGPGDQGAGPIDLEVPAPVYTSVDSATFRTLLEHYRYDPVPPDPRLTGVEEGEAWSRERIWIDGPSGDSILLYLYTPASAAPPFQTLVFVPGSNVFFNQSVPEAMEWSIGPAIRGGRAVLAVVMDGMVERGFPPGTPIPAPPTVRFRDLMVKHATELRLAMDYAISRPEVDGDRLAYVGVSWGAGSRLGFAAVDDRFRAVIFIGGGIDERVKPTLPEADNVNFAPYVTPPTLLLNGTNDEDHPWLYRALPLWNLLTEPKELILVEGGGHVVPLEDRIPAINDFLDRMLGPVRRR